MEITAVELIGLAVFWSFFISSYPIILQDYPGMLGLNISVVLESDEMLLDALDPIVNEIEDRMHEKLEQFQSSFFWFSWCGQ